VAALEAAAADAVAEGVDAVFVTTGPLGDAVTLAAGLSASTPNLLLGIRTNLGSEPHRHPTMLARELTTLDLICDGRALLAFSPPFTDGVVEAIALCRAMWRQGISASEGPHYPVAGAINRPRPRQPDGPRIAVDLTDGTLADPALLRAADLVLVPYAVEGTPAPPPGVTWCRIRA
jgi:alkanesulfonate monooxygenase SsuD/methylene tetrahydromethanopterin reductase-like flavin-dependent oxidoreductase (luciferase family)